MHTVKIQSRFLHKLLLDCFWETRHKVHPLIFLVTLLLAGRTLLVALVRER